MPRADLAGRTAPDGFSISFSVAARSEFQEASQTPDTKIPAITASAYMAAGDSFVLIGANKGRLSSTTEALPARA